MDVDDIAEASGNHSASVKPDNIIIEFLEVSIHQLLYVQQIYPLGIFSRKQKYGVPVQVSNHPLVNNYITQCLKTAQELLKRNELTKLIILFCSNEGKPVKRIVFDISSLQKGITIERQDEEQLEMALRDVFLRLAVCDRRLQSLPGGCTFKLLLGTQEHSHIAMSKNSALKVNQDFPWTQCGLQQLQVPVTCVVPLSSLDACGVRMQVYAEEPQRSYTQDPPDLTSA